MELWIRLSSAPGSNPAGKSNRKRIMYLHYRVTKEDEGQTAEHVLRRRLGVSGALSRRLRNGRALTSDGTFIMNRTVVEPGSLLEVRLEEENEQLGPLNPKEDIAIYFEDDWFALVSKPPATPTHPRFPGDRGLTTVLSDKQLHPANRLDLDTSGLVIIAKNGFAHHLLTTSPIQKIYYGLVHGLPPEEGVIDAPIDRAPDSIILRMIREDGKRARTHFRRVAAWPRQQTSLLAFRLETGRTHQIRVHSAHLGFPLVGDSLYGWEQTFRARSEIRGRNRANYLMADKRVFSDPGMARDFRALALNRELYRQFLHAARLRFVHPLTKEMIDVRAPLPADLCRLLRKLNAVERAQICHTSLQPLMDLDLPANVETTAE